ncbi:hypothetical protein [Ulvibacter litoralis]|uniref:Uncharacterized protein n=1 Tax=Ulvibacter litoralis TaxID=227084 RepID=A0A1G7JVD1_9FLAO|nr:hypothetical protein [Ulvibacter litoralis]GHC65532.1 hypothetical protein GCM10008083_33410 [Ulvibacter litoralis]SDF28907.1 hypothetical protein SAMN05421855_1321 [Ulvibacter litoralis]
MTKYQKLKLILAACFCTILLLILCNYSSNGRYSFGENNRVILDTKTGDIYLIENQKYVKLNGFTEMKLENEEE